MLKYRLPLTNNPDYVMVFSAEHAEAFNRAAKAAATTMGAMRQAQGAYGVLKTGRGYNAGAFNIRTVTVTDALPVDELDQKSVALEVDRVTLNELKRQLNGHVRIALTEALKASGAASIYLIFYSGGPLLIFLDEGPNREFLNTPYRVGLVRFEEASTMAEEQQCVEANRASAAAFEDFWTQIDEQNRQEAVETNDAVTDVLDEPGEPVARPVPTFVVTNQFDDEEDELDDYESVSPRPIITDETDGALPAAEFDAIDRADEQQDEDATEASVSGEDDYPF